MPGFGAGAAGFAAGFPGGYAEGTESALKSAESAFDLDQKKKNALALAELGASVQGILRSGGTSSAYPPSPAPGQQPAPFSQPQQANPYQGLSSSIGAPYGTPAGSVPTVPGQGDVTQSISPPGVVQPNFDPRAQTLIGSRYPGAPGGPQSSIPVGYGAFPGEGPSPFQQQSPAINRDFNPNPTGPTSQFQPPTTAGMLPGGGLSAPIYQPQPGGGPSQPPPSGQPPMSASGMAAAPGSPITGPGASPFGQQQPFGQQRQPLTAEAIVQATVQRNPNIPPDLLARVLQSSIQILAPQERINAQMMALDYKYQALQQREYDVDRREHRLDRTEDERERRNRAVEEEKVKNRERLADQFEQNQKFKRDNLENTMKNQQELRRQGRERLDVTGLRTQIDTQHRQAMEEIQAFSINSALPPEERSRLLKQQDDFYREQINKLREMAQGGSQQPAPQQSATKDQSRPYTDGDITITPK